MGQSLTGGRPTALVHDVLTNPGGSEEVFREIVDMVDGPVFTAIWDEERIGFVKQREVHASWLNHLPQAKRRHYIYAPLMPGVYRGFNMKPYDVILSDSHSFGHAVRKRSGALHICYYHSPARSLWLPEVDGRATGGRFATLKRVIVKRLKAIDLQSAKGVDVAFANSSTTAERLERFYGVKAEIIYPPVDTSKYIGVQRQSEEEGFLMWGRLVPYKRFDLAIELARKTGQRVQIVGGGPLEAELKSQARGLPNVVFHGRLTDEDLMKLMSRCRAVLFPTYEDFGIVPVEAMAAGLPVIAYSRGGASESVTKACGELMSDQTVDALIQAAESIGRRDFNVSTLRAQASLFDVHEFRRKYSQAVDKAVHQHFGSA